MMNRRLLALLLLVGLLLCLRLLLLGSLFGGGRLDLGLNLVAQIDVLACGLVVRGEVVLFAELPQFGG